MKRSSFKQFLILKKNIYGMESIGLSVQKKLNIDFQDGGHGGHLGFRIWTKK